MDAEECLEDIETLAWKFPVGSMIDYARERDLPLAMINHLEDMQRAAATLVLYGPDALQDFIDELKRLQPESIFLHP